MKRNFSTAIAISFILTLLTVCMIRPVCANSDILLGITWKDSLLVSFDPSAGTVTEVHAQLNPDESFRGLSYDSSHNMLYALSQVSLNLYSIDPVTLDIQHIGNLRLPCGNADIGGLTYNSLNDSFYTTLCRVDGESSDLLSVNVNNAEVNNLGKITKGYCFSPSYNPEDGRIYSFVLSGSGTWKSSYKSTVIKINPDDVTMTRLFETPYHTTLGLAKKPYENSFYSWVNWSSHFYGKINTEIKNITALGSSDSIGVASDAMICRTFYVGSGSLLPTEGKPVSFDLTGHVIEIRDPNNLIRKDIALGNKISVQFTYDLYDIFLNTDELSTYGISIKIGNRTFSFNDFRAGVENNHYNCNSGDTYDSFYINSEYEDKKFGFISLFITLRDYSSASLTNNLFLPDKFDLLSWDIIDFYLFSTDSSGLKGFSIQGAIDEIISDADSDEDGIPDHSDKCPSDPYKKEPGICGCGIADSDSDGDSDGSLDCNDNCPGDSGKTDPGICGCGRSDADNDMDGTEDCNDDCPDDPGKIYPGQCGCGVADTDMDRDGICDCADLCPGDSQKLGPGICGCGIPDSDSDDDEIPDCEDDNDDNDGLPDKEEHGPDGKSPDYDGNDDGKADCLQDNVVSFHTFDDLNYLTMTASDGILISNCKVSENPSPDIPPSEVEFVYGFFKITIENANVGGSAEVSMHLPFGETFNTYYKYGPTSDNNAEHWYEFLYDGQTGAEITGNVITLHFIDGMRGDDDLSANGIVSDAGGPGISLNTAGNRGGGGCFITTAADSDIKKQQK